MKQTYFQEDEWRLLFWLAMEPLCPPSLAVEQRAILLRAAIKIMEAVELQKQSDVRTILIDLPAFVAGLEDDS